MRDVPRSDAMPFDNCRNMVIWIACSLRVGAYARQAAERADWRDTSYSRRPYFVSMDNFYKGGSHFHDPQLTWSEVLAKSGSRYMYSYIYLVSVFCREPFVSFSIVSHVNRGWRGVASVSSGGMVMLYVIVPARLNLVRTSGLGSSWLLSRFRNVAMQLDSRMYETAGT